MVNMQKHHTRNTFSSWSWTKRTPLKKWSKLDTNHAICWFRIVSNTSQKKQHIMQYLIACIALYRIYLRMHIHQPMHFFDWDFGSEASTPSWHLLARLHSNPWPLAASAMSWPGLVHTSSNVLLDKYNRVQHLQSSTVICFYYLFII